MSENTKVTVPLGRQAVVGTVVYEESALLTLDRFAAVRGLGCRTLRGN
jgi:hypothetical protein